MHLWGADDVNTYYVPWSLFSVDNNTNLGEKDAAEKVPPNFNNLLKVEIIVPILCYVTIWNTVNVLVNANCWTTYQEGLKRKRLVNVTTSLISGTYFLLFLFRFPGLMFGAPLHYYGYLDIQILMFTIGYFIYDAYDLIINDKISIQTGVLLVHHIGAIFAIAIPLASHKLVLFSYWALLMEVSSIFLHIRSIFHFSKMSSNPRFSEITKILLILNLVFFVIFRFIVQVWMLFWAFYNKDNMHTFYFVVAIVANSGFLLINAGLFLRILYSDGFMGSTKVSRSQLDALLEDNEYAAIEQHDHLEEESSEDDDDDDKLSKKGLENIV